MSEFDCTTIIIHRSQSVAASSKRNDPGSIGNQSLQVAPIDLAALGVELRDVESHPPLFHQSLPRSHVSVMLEFRDDYLVTGSERSSQGARQVINHRCSVWTEDYFVSRRI